MSAQTTESTLTQMFSQLPFETSHIDGEQGLPSQKISISLPPQTERPKQYIQDCILYRSRPVTGLSQEEWFKLSHSLKILYITT